MTRGQGTTAAIVAVGVCGAVGAFFAPATFAVGDYGPDTCLQGFVWREAVRTDHVCVSGNTRAQTKVENAQAAAHRSPNGGPYGPDTCSSGYVWREAVAGDHVCVTPDRRSLAAEDNRNAAARRNTLRVRLATYTIPPRCDGGACQRGSTDDIPRYRVRVENINTGTALVELRRNSNGVLVRRWSAPSRTAAGAPGGRVSLDTNVFRCSRGSDSYFRVKDPVSSRWSARIPAATNCKVL